MLFVVILAKTHSGIPATESQGHTYAMPAQSLAEVTAEPSTLFVIPWKIPVEYSCLLHVLIGTGLFLSSLI